MPSFTIPYILIYILVGYVLLCVLLYYLQEPLIFRAEKLSQDFKFDHKDQTSEEYHLETRDGAVINGLLFKSPKPKGVVLYLKGNSKSIKGWGKFAADFTKYGYNVLMPDYRGYGKSKGKRTQSRLIRDMQIIYEEIRKRVPEENIIVYGRSLGTGLAIKLASTNNPKMVIVEAPYYSLTKLVNRFLPFIPIGLFIKYPLPAHKWLRFVKCPIHIIHGTKDALIPFKTSLKLINIQPELTTLHTVIGGGHKNLSTFKSYHRILANIITWDYSEEHS